MKQHKARSRFRSNRRTGQTAINVANRVFESSGAHSKIRGTPQQIIDKYMSLVRDAQLANDRVAAEHYQQYAEHYTRLLGQAKSTDDTLADKGDGSGGGNRHHSVAALDAEKPTAVATNNEQTAGGAGGASADLFNENEPNAAADTHRNDEQDVQASKAETLGTAVHNGVDTPRNPASTTHGGADGGNGERRTLSTSGRGTLRVPMFGKT